MNRINEIQHILLKRNYLSLNSQNSRMLIFGKFNLKLLKNEKRNIATLNSQAGSKQRQQQNATESESISNYIK